MHLPDNYSFPAQGLAFPSLQITLPYFLCLIPGPQFESFHFLAVLLWAGCLASLDLSFPIGTVGSLPCLPSQGLMKMCPLAGGLAWHQSCSRHRVWVGACIFTAYIPDGSYSYMTSSASEFLHSLTFPGAPGAQVVHSQVEVRHSWR